MNSPVIFFNIGWMRAYRGLGDGDEIQGGGRYIADHGLGGEIMNFLPIAGKLYGCVQTPRSGQISLERLGGDPTDNHLTGVTIVWTARRPEGGTVAVGWYRNATLFRDYQQQIQGRMEPYARHDLGGHYIATAKTSDCHLIDPENRWFDIPRSRPGKPGGMGQANVWYAEGTSQERWFRDLMRCIHRGKDPVQTRSRKRATRRGGSPGRQADPQLRAKTEAAAIQAITLFYKKRGFTVKSFEHERCGWDLLCSNGRIDLHVEVKGTIGTAITAELTPNEYQYLQTDDPCYRLAIVTRSLSSPTPHVFEFDRSSESWISQTRHRIELAERTSAEIRHLSFRMG